MILSFKNGIFLKLSQKYLFQQDIKQFDVAEQHLLTIFFPMPISGQ